MEEQDLDALGLHISRNDLVVLAGAGVSAASPACVPLFRPLRDGILRALTESLRTELPPPVLAVCEGLFHAAQYPRSPSEPVPEVLFEALETVLGNALYPLLKTLLAVEAPNANHLFLARLLGQGVRLLITTNFEDGFERTLEAEGKHPRILADGAAIAGSLSSVLRGPAGEGSLTLWKPHGTLTPGLEETIRITLSQVAREAYDEEKLGSMTEVLRHLPVLVVGYSGYDHDISRTFYAAAETGPGLFWLSWKEPQKGEPCSSILDLWGDRGHLLVGDMTTLFRRLAPRLDLKWREASGSPDCRSIYDQRSKALDAQVAKLPRLRRLMALAVLTRMLSQPETALILLSKVEQDPEADRINQIAALVVCCNILKELERYRECEEALSRLRSLAAPGEKGLESAILHLQGEIHLGRHEYDRAAEVYEQALLLARAAGEAGMEWAILQSLGVLRAKYGRSQEAEDHFARALEIARDLGGRVEALKARYEMGILAFEREDFPAAEGIFRNVLTESRDLGEKDLERSALYELGLIAKRFRASYLEAAELLNASLEIARELGNKVGQIRCLVALADVTYDEALATREERLFREAVRQYTECINSAKEHGDIESLGSALAGRGRCWALLRNLEGVNADLMGLQELTRRHDLPFLKGEIDLLERASRLLQAE